jgi:hypothetical protein
MVYSISYDLNKPGQDYSALYSAIKDLGSWCHPLDSTWFVVTELTATDVRDSLVGVMDKSDALIVTRATQPGAWKGLSDEITRWLKANL